LNKQFVFEQTSGYKVAGGALAYPATPVRTPMHEILYSVHRPVCKLKKTRE